jgi:RNA-directed DNA polymerase
MQKTLRRWATEHPADHYRDLSNLLGNAGWLRGASLQVHAHQGRDTAGRDKATMRNCNGNLEGNLEALRQRRKPKTFAPTPVTRVYIAKPNGKKRPLGSPTIQERIGQEALRMMLEPIWAADFRTRSYGFRPKRSTYDAISSLRNRLAGAPGWG